MIKKIIFLGLGMALLASCNTKFSVNGEYEEKAIVHFLLDQGQEYQFLKLNKTFLKEGNANEFAKDPALSNFDNVVATVKEIKNGSTLRTWTLQDTVINNKKEGTFYGPEQKLYFFKANDLDEEAIYRLSIDVDNGNHLIKGQTELVKDVKINYPQSFQSLNFADNNVFVNGYKSTPITYTAGTGAIFKTQLRFDYREFTASGQTDKSILWNLGEAKGSDLVGSTFSTFAKGEVFYELLSKRILVDPAVTKRNVSGFEIILTVGSDDLYTYMLTNEPTSSLAQNKPTYSNVEGALGIFSSRVTIKQYKAAFNSPITRALNQNSTQELCKGPYTVALKFCSDIVLDNSTSYYCN
ncbi:MAG TPA: DUF4249 family protein [Brumimicrobium sp.]|nr:DUF4249 family protein [Brumimicrobium sp.]